MQSYGVQTCCLTAW